MPNPSGKLPITFPKALADLPAHTPEQYPGVGPKHKTVAQYSEKLLVGYRWYDAQKIEPLYPFGYGLSYTSFAYSNLSLSSKTLSVANPTLTLDFDIANTGQRAGAEVAQVYVGLPSQAERPSRRNSSRVSPGSKSSRPDGARPRRPRCPRLLLLGRHDPSMEGCAGGLPDLRRLLFPRYPA